MGALAAKSAARRRLSESRMATGPLPAAEAGRPASGSPRRPASEAQEAPSPAGTGPQRRRPRLPPAARRAGAQGSRAGECLAAAVANRQPALLSGIRPEGDRGAAEKDEAGDPNQVDQRLYERPEEERAVGVDLVGDEEEVLPVEPVGPNRGLVGDLLLGEVAVLARPQRPERLTIT